ncbi:MAG TPA: ribosome maturation factor RimM [Paludibacter sp.]|nr:ribosome maturation factor RimM [Paludibacter sp.]
MKKNVIFAGRVSIILSNTLMLHKDNLIEIGKVIKPHGIHGEMSFTYTVDIFEVDDLPFFIFEIDGILVPFKVSEYRIRSDSTGFLTLEGIESEDEARAFDGLAIYVNQSVLATDEHLNLSLEYFVGFQLTDVLQGKVGVITDIDRTTANVLYVVEKEDSELLIPVAEDYIREINHDLKEVVVKLPEGLLDL